MPTPQPGILLDPVAAPTFLVLKASESSEAEHEVARVAAALPEWAEATEMEGGRSGGVRATVAFGSELWKRLSPEAPKRLAPLRPIEGTGGKAVATDGDLFVHVHSERRDLAVALMLRVLAELGDAALVLEEVHGFRYLDSRDFTGFVLGTGNPPAEERAAQALVGDEDPHFAGGSYVLVQRYVHNLRYWARLSSEEQERAIGRRKNEGEELSDDTRPKTSHASRVALAEEGRKLEIVRHGSPYAAAGEQGLYFVAYCRTPVVFEKILARMFGTSGDGLQDRLMDFTRAVSGGLFFAPSLEALAAITE